MTTKKSYVELEKFDEAVRLAEMYLEDYPDYFSPEWNEAEAIKHDMDMVLIRVRKMLLKSLEEQVQND